MEQSPQSAPACAILHRLPIFNRKQETVATSLSFVDGGENETDSRSLLRHGLNQLQERSDDAPLGTAPVVVTVSAQDLNVVIETPWPLATKILHIDTGALPIEQWRDSADAVAAQGFDCILHHGTDPGPPAKPKLWSATVSELTPEVLAAPLPRLWAQQVDTRDAFQTLSAQGSVEWISGEFWKRPAIQAPRSLPASQVGSLRLLARLQNPDVDVAEIEQIISCDPTLTYKLLKLLNSAFFCSPSRVQSIHHGVTFFGLQRIKNWATVIVMNSVEFLPHEILPLGAYRAHLAEVLAQALKRSNAPQYYLVGLFSVLDALFDCKLEQLVAPLNLHDEIANALLTHQGLAGELLRWVIGAELGQPVWTDELQPLRELDLMRIQLEAMTWANEFCRCMSGA